MSTNKKTFCQFFLFPFNTINDTFTCPYARQAVSNIHLKKQIKRWNISKYSHSKHTNDYHLIIL